MSDNEFNEGDLVQLKSGGPLDPNSTYSCTWFSGAKHNKQTFREKALVLYKEGK